MKITRLFYVQDEVYCSFITELLKSENIEEVYFWFSELFYSGFKKKCIAILWDIYNKYYRLKQPEFEYIMQKKIKLYKETKDEVQLFNIVTNMFSFKKSLTIFSFVTIINKKAKKHNEHKELNNEIIQELINDLSNKDLNGKEIIDFCTKYSFYDFCKKTFIKLLESMYNIKFNSSTTSEIVYYLYALSRNIINEESILKNKKNQNKIIYRKRILPQHFENIKNIELNKRNINNRLYKVNENIGCFKLNSMYDPSFYVKFFEHWEYYAYKSPIWKSRFKKYNIIVNADEKQIIFKDEDEKEEFYNKYYFDLEDASYENFSKSIFEIKKNSICNWCCYVKL